MSSRKALCLGLLMCVLAAAGCQGDVASSTASNPPVGPSAEGSSVEETTTDLGASLVDLARGGSVPGLAYAIVDNNGIIDSAGYGFADIENDVEATADTLFHVGSTHKAMTALLVATLVDEGVLDWDTPVAELATDFDIDPAITVRHLLTMTSGLPADAEDLLPERVDQSDVADTVFALIEETVLAGPPGSTFEYSNLSASAAGYAASLAAIPGAANGHQRYLDLFASRVLEPLGMQDSVLLASDARASGQLAASYELDGDQAIRLESEDIDNDLLAPSGSLKSSANDMALFLQMLLADGANQDGRQLVSTESIDAMWEPGLEGYAMGWETGDLRGISYLFHEGSFDGFLSIIMIVPDKDIAMVLLTNSEDAAGELIAALPRIVIESVA
jgi:CubicO group peptidase (beta-lactamase class C family)